MVAETADRPTVGEVMSAPVTTVTPTTDLWMAAERMRCDGVRHLVVTSEGQYSGVVSATDLAPYCSRASLDIEWSGEPLSVEAPTEEARAGD
jgi:signal-transduction protein with cAMP-binding, CBS, and nucleotidyltransferase domain